MNADRAKAYYEQIGTGDLCSCDYCKNYIGEIRAAYPEVSSYLDRMGVDIAKPFETMPLEPDEAGYIDYPAAQYIVYGEADEFVETTIGSVTVCIAQCHPSTGIEEAHFVIELSPIRLKWRM